MRIIQVTYVLSLFLCVPAFTAAELSTEPSLGSERAAIFALHDDPAGGEAEVTFDGNPPELAPIEFGGHSMLDNIFGKDDRISLTSSAYPWSTIGRLSMGCTGTLVARDLVLTAAHCVMDSDTKKLIKDVIYFYPNYKGGNYKHSSYAVHVWWGTNDPNKHRGYDWAILRLKHNLGDRYGWLGTKATTGSNYPNGLTVVGYSGNYKSGQTAGIHHNCRTRKRFPSHKMIYHDCDTGRGSSGGPTLRMYDDALTITGLNVAENRNGGTFSLWREKYEHKYANIVIPSVDFVDKLIDILNG